jgi:recombination protein RecT
MSKLEAALKGRAEPREPSAYERFRAQLNLVRSDVARLCGEQNVDRFIRVALNAVQANPKLIEPRTSRRTLLLACLKAAQDGLLPDGREAVFNIYSTKDKEQSKTEGRDVWVDVVQYMPMSYGLIQKIYEAGASYVDAVPVYARDVFDYQRGDEPRINHKPYAGDEEPGDVIAAYIIIKLRSGEVKREVMFRREIERVRQKSKAPDGLMWKEFYDQGAVKSVVHRVVKQLPRSEPLERTLRHDNEVVGLEDVPLPAEMAGVDLEALVDGRLEAAARAVSGGGAAISPAAPSAASVQQSGGDASNASGGTETQAGPLPKKGDPGTPAIKAAFLSKMKACSDLDVLDIIADDSRFFTWDKKDAAEIAAEFTARRRELEKP